MSTAEERARMAQMPLVDYVQWMLANGYYDIDVETGQVTNLRTGRRLKWIMGKDGYPYVELTFSRFVQRPIRIHRFIAIKRDGAENVKGLQVAHLDSVRHHSYGGNLKAMTALEHVRYDKTNNLPPPQPKHAWPACARCGDPNGKIGKGCKTPTRVTGARFGIAAQICLACYRLLQNREARKKRAIR